MIKELGKAPEAMELEPETIEFNEKQQAFHTGWTKKEMRCSSDWVILKESVHHSYFKMLLAYAKRHDKDVELKTKYLIVCVQELDSFLANLEEYKKTGCIGLMGRKPKK